MKSTLDQRYRHKLNMLVLLILVRIELHQDRVLNEMALHEMQEENAERRKTGDIKNRRGKIPCRMPYNEERD